MIARQTPFSSATFVALGDGLAAGAADFGLSEILQAYSFPAQVAAQLGTPFPQPLIEAPGIGPVFGTQELPPRLPQPMQTTVLVEFPPSAPFANVSIPCITLAESLTRRPTSPVLHRSDALQTAINLILGLPGLMMPGSQQMPTQVEYAAYRQPTFIIVALGLTEVLRAAERGDAAWIPDDVSFRAHYGQLLAQFVRVPSTVMLATLPDPRHTALLTPVGASARVLKATPSVVQAMFGLDEDDYLTPEGLIEAGSRLLMHERGPLAANAVVPAAAVARISERVAGLNAQLRALASEHGALVLDLHRLYASVKQQGVVVAGRYLSGEYLGGFFSLNGVSPGKTGHGVIANEVIRVLNAECGTTITPVSLEALIADDPVADYRPADGPDATEADMAARPVAVRALPVSPSARPRSAGPRAVRAHITLPPSLEVTLPLHPESSYFGDGLRACHATIERDIPFGSSPNTLFGGLCLVQSHVKGSLHVRFAPPVDDIAHFELSVGEGLAGNDGELTAPQLYRLPATGSGVSDIKGLVSSGDLDLATGDVSNIRFYFGFGNSALMALVSVNPHIPPTPIEFSSDTRTDADNPHYGSAWAKFEQLEDGTLDFLFNGTTFLPLGPGFGGVPLKFPLPFAGPSGQFASVPSVGTALHPHILLSTRPPEEALPFGDVPQLPANTVREYTVYPHGSAFGDRFDLNVPEMEGGATGRSHLTGRLLVQFGAPTANSLPFTVTTVLPGGMFATPPDSPVAKAFPGRLSVGLLAHDERLRFPKVHYDMHGVAWVDDPFELSLGSIDLRTGRVLGTFQHRGFIVQNVLLKLIELEPRTPKSSWRMRGPAAFQRNGDGQTVFTFNGGDWIPFPEGFGFPKPDLQSCFVVGPGSRLDPYFYLTASDGVAPPASGKSGEASGLVASNGQRFSYKYAFAGYSAGRPAMFEYTNEGLNATFRMGSLVWVSFTNRNRAAEPGECDCVTFTGIGLWSTDMKGPHMCTVSISTNAEHPYVSILIDGGQLSNVNTKPSKGVLPFPELVRCP
ncbi:MAG: hypothetical protein ABL982_02590 [Vicinamibacterales bacterium]